MLCPCIFLCCSVDVSVCCVLVNCLVKQFAICLLNVMDVFSVGGGALLDRPCMVFHIMCMLYL